MITDEDLRFMRIALDEADKGHPSPNPHVGAVITRDGAIVAVGHHPKAGEGHAEANAIRAAGDAARGATLYVTLEPCNHHGRTPPCTDAILAAGIARVVVGCPDPLPHVPGAIPKLEQAGIEVEMGVLEDEARYLIADFAKHRRTGRAFVVAKAALTLDGKMATRTGSSQWITGPEARAEVHRLRATSDAVMVGAGTALADDPALTVRHVEGPNPLRVVVDAKLKTPPSAAVFRLEEARTIVYHGPEATADRRRLLADAGVELVEVASDPKGAAAKSRLPLAPILDDLGRRQVVRLLVEGGPRLLSSFFAERLVDRVVAFIAPKIVGDSAAPGLADDLGVREMSDALRIVSPRVRRFGDDVLIMGDLDKRDPEPHARPTEAN